MHSAHASSTYKTIVFWTLIHLRKTCDFNSVPLLRS